MSETISRDNFSEKVKKLLQERAGNHCSNPSCRCLTSGPNYDDMKASRIGVAAHISAAAQGGPRYDIRLSSEERKSINNGIWLCQNCAKLIDSDENFYTKQCIIEWKRIAEETARAEMKGYLINEEKQINLKDYIICPFCDTSVKRGLLICKGCQAEVIYGLTTEEWKQDIQLGTLMSFISIYYIFSLIKINITTNISLFILVVIFSIFCGYLIARLHQLDKLKKMPRFFRKMIN
ncbi:hypothetical protein V8P92_14200 [Acinetobacter baumannii]|uniref:hypothetical protein n=1 Tax=Acinetobacter baumannii TaxID=470 RepID=UPI00233F3BFB|nr:hypothetical protein [Acinetobacter baumannii]MDN8247751.1 hypothetical protein [Acinetobacter baumannii]MDO7399059.1 hypothetical protein [Acinetobacter baumannii]MDO7452343.1 hypothetical protein [Acinetobacter baumannii]